MQPAFGYAKNLGSIAAGSSGSALFAVGHYRDPALWAYSVDTSEAPLTAMFQLVHGCKRDAPGQKPVLYVSASKSGVLPQLLLQRLRNGIVHVEQL